MTNHQRINQSSSDVEWYTPGIIIEAARRTMGGIELDPASSEAANAIVRAERFYTIKDDAMQQTWRAKTLFMNHPFGRAEDPCPPDCTKKHKHHDFRLYGNAAWVNKLRDSIGWDKVEQAICITFACTSEAWFQPLLIRPQCFLCPRTNYRTPDGRIVTGVSKGSAVTYFGNNIEAFAREFSPLGVVKVKYA